ncbi:MAG TPA: hypothetical protein PKU94_01710 [Candidatus Hydrothermia bacterium]|nr:hypothetical protein [Candidatus Hydrothermae bacterium]MDD3649135.1 hypothetical protein [Candidatus Hydrothermia bacterium]MDD5572196.1 hypothetical protein [Candidatus Hydrothermia bacterium]HOK23075.1 hypothetical protein [Candidatus Hydrothermia bacterium]HOL23665.1 hypothetical protein [Candidatus Hydrothermia bacterium]
MEFIELHGIFNILAFISIVVALLQARKHRMKVHHILVSLTLVFMTFAVFFMLAISGGFKNSHCVIGFVIYLFALLVLISGFLFKGRKIKRNVHKTLGIVAAALLLAQIVWGIALSAL